MPARNLHVELGDPERYKVAVRDILRLLAAHGATDNDAELYWAELSDVVTRIGRIGQAFPDDLPAVLGHELHGWLLVVVTLVGCLTDPEAAELLAGRDEAEILHRVEKAVDAFIAAGSGETHGDDAPE